MHFGIKTLIVFPSQLYSNTIILKGNQIVLPQYFNDAYDDKPDGLFVSINSTHYASVFECSATKNSCFLSYPIMRKLNLKQGDKVEIQLIDKYSKAQKIIFNTLNIMDQNQFQILLPELEIQLYNEIPQFRCLQLNDIIPIKIALKVYLLKVKDIGNNPFVCMNDTDVEVEIKFKEIIRIPKEESKDQFEVNQEEQEYYLEQQQQYQKQQMISEKSKDNQSNQQGDHEVIGYVIGTGEQIKVKPIQ